MLSLNYKNVQHVKIYLPCNFEVNCNTYFGVIALLSSNFQNFNTFRFLFQKLWEIDVKFNSKHVQHVKIYLVCNFKVNLITHLEVIALFSSNFKNVNTFHPLFQKLRDRSKCKLKTCSACQDLHALQFWSIAITWRPSSVH